MKKIIDKAIVLRRVNYGESDRVITMLTQQNGKISVFAKGCRKQKSRLSGGIELLCLSEVGYIDGKSKLRTLTSASLIHHHQELVRDIKITKNVFEALKKVDKLSDDDAGQEYFQTLSTYLSCLCDDSYDLDLVEAWFNLQLLNISGVLGSVSVEGENTSQEYKFDFDKHQFRASSGGSFSRNDIKLIRLLKSQDKPIRLMQKLGSESNVLGFTGTLMSINLT